MPMPSLFKYFAFVGVALFGLLSLANFLLDPSTGATAVATAPAKQIVAVQHDPRASKIERWRDDQAALKTAHQTQTSQNASLVTKSVAEPATTATIPQAKPQPAPQVAAVAPEPAQPQPAAAPAPAPESAAIVGAESTDELAAARAAKVAGRKAKVAKAKARKERLARQTLARDRYASNQQDQFYYGQRQQHPLVTHYSSAIAPQQSFGPFNNGGWGRAW